MGKVHFNYLPSINCFLFKLLKLLISYSFRFGTIASLNTGDDDSSDDETNKHYAGGSEHSGQLIKGNKDKIKVTDVFNSAKE